MLKDERQQVMHHLSACETLHIFQGFTFLPHFSSELDKTTLLDDDDDDNNVEDNKEDSGRLVRDRRKAAAEKWVKVKEASF